MIFTQIPLVRIGKNYFFLYIFSDFEPIFVMNDCTDNCQKFHHCQNCQQLSTIVKNCWHIVIFGVILPLKKKKMVKILTNSLGQAWGGDPIADFPAVFISYHHLCNFYICNEIHHRLLNWQTQISKNENKSQLSRAIPPSPLFRSAWQKNIFLIFSVSQKRCSQRFPSIPNPSHPTQCTYRFWAFKPVYTEAFKTVSGSLW